MTWLAKPDGKFKELRGYDTASSKMGITAKSNTEVTHADDAGAGVSWNGAFVGAGVTRYVGGAIVAQLLPN